MIHLKGKPFLAVVRVYRGVALVFENSERVTENTVMTEVLVLNFSEKTAYQRAPNGVDVHNLITAPGF
jgi:hypothetical protein